jgi:acetyl-CoA carboxylase biotin carboxyl carrier protein
VARRKAVPRSAATAPDRSDAAPITAEQIVKLAVRHHLAEIEIEQAGIRIRVVREHAPAAGAPARLPEPVAQPQPVAVESAAAITLVPIEAPMVGTFYRAPAPGAEPFVGEGDVVKPGQVLCIIEAMKLMNEIEAKVSGRIARVLVENGQPVEYGQHLFLVEPR